MVQNQLKLCCRFIRQVASSVMKYQIPIAKYQNVSETYFCFRTTFDRFLYLISSKWSCIFVCVDDLVISISFNGSTIDDNFRIQQPVQFNVLKDFSPLIKNLPLTLILELSFYPKGNCFFSLQESGFSIETMSM